MTTPNRHLLSPRYSESAVQGDGGIHVRAISPIPTDVSWSSSSVADPHNQSKSDKEDGREPGSYSTLTSFSWLSRLTFSWIAPLRSIGQLRGSLEMEDIKPLEGYDSTSYLSDWFERVWHEEVTSVQQWNRIERWKSWRNRTIPRVKSPSLLRSLFKCFGWYYLSLGFLKLISDCLMFSGPVLLGYLVTFVESYDHDTGATTSSETAWHGYVYAGGLVVGVLLNAILSTQYSFAIRRVGLCLRAVIITAVYRKALCISNTARNEFSSGRINNIMSVDTDRISDISISFHEFWSLPIQIALALFLLYREVSWSLLAGLTIVVLLIPINAYLTKRINEVSKAMMSFKDERISLLDECIRHIRIIKFMAFEQKMSKRVLAVREKEMKQLSIRKYLDALCVYFWATTPILVSLVTFSMYSYLLGHTLTSSKVFTSLALFNILIRPLNAFPWVVNGLVEGRVSAIRIYQFLKAQEFGVEDDDSEEDEVPQSEWHSPTSPSTKKIEPTRTVSQSPHDPQKCVICLEGSFDYVLPKPEKKTTDKSTIVTIEVKSDENVNPSTHSLALDNISLHVHSGECIGVQGLVGSGKTTLLLGILGELSLSHRHRAPNDIRSIHGRVAYVSQEVWLPNGTIRENILFHSPYDPIRYNLVLDACALKPDLLTLASGDHTEVGEGGINLSGGQLMRLSLARACYAQVDIYLFDDPLSSVDAHVGAHLIQHVFGRKGILHDKTRILVTHHVGLMKPHVDRMLTMSHSKIIADDTFDQIRPIAEIAVTDSTSSPPVESSPSAPSSTSTSSPSVTSPPAAAAAVINTKSAADVKAEEEAERAAREKGFLTAAESRARGSIRSRVLRAYLSFIGWILCGVIIFSMFLMQGSRNSCDWWLSYWVENATQDESPGGGGETADDAHYYLRIFAYLAAGNSIAALFRSFIFAYGGLKAARNLFRTLLQSILHAPIAFFDANPVGRILNRFSSDMYSLDENIPFQGNIFLAQLFMLLGSLVVISAVVPVILILLPILGFIYYKIQASYRNVSRELRRLDSTSRSPLYANFSETLTGVTIIRAFAFEAIFQAQNRTILDANQKVQFSNLGMSNWLNLRLQCIGVTMITLVAFLAIVSCLYPVSWMHFLLNPSMIGLGIAYALPLTDTMNGLIGSFTDTEKEIISVERTVEYIRIKDEDHEQQVHNQEREEDEDQRSNDEETHRQRKKRNIENEDLHTSLLPTSASSTPLTHIDELAPSPSWPSQGAITFDHVTFSYRPELEPALRDISFEIKPGERVGIVGRTGSGKSSLFQALFRMRDISSGRILIDGRDISTMPRQLLRTRLSIIPQAPVLFSGTIRSNLLPYDDSDLDAIDPRERITDEQIWHVLRQCHMEAKIKSMEQGLSTCLSESIHLSVGERQLLCFARALLKKSRVIVLDEATASVDLETDGHIQSLTLTLSATILLIAHRLSSVMSLDTILVMDDSHLVEMDQPQRLIANPNSKFAQLVRQAETNQTNNTSNNHHESTSDRDEEGIS